VIVRAAGDAFDLAPAHWELVLDIVIAFGVVRRFLRLDIVGIRADNTRRRFMSDHFDANMLWLQVKGVLPPVEPPLAPAVVPFILRARPDKILHLHLFELAVAKDKVPGDDFVAEGFADLRNAERYLLAHRFLHVAEIDEDTLRGFR